jgi:hypothetical protein
VTGDAAPALLVPLTVEALTLVQDSANGAWSWGQPSYRRLNTYDSVDPGPFDATAPHLPDQPGFTGAVLHWALPDGVTHGTQTGPDGPVTYPAIPNRWLVVRTAPDPGNVSRWASTAWIVASDVLGDPAGSPFPGTDGNTPTTLGRCWPLADWPGEAAMAGLPATPDPLTAVGPGDAPWAGSVPNVTSVVGFADALAGVDRGPLTYRVFGWYGTPAQDPLFGAARYGPAGWSTIDGWTDLMAGLRWSVGDAAGVADAVAAAGGWAAAHGRTVDPSRPHTMYPARTLCQGLLSDVTWLGAGGPVFSAVPTSNPQAAGYVRPQVGTGHNAIDALAAIIAQDETGQLQPDEIRQFVNILQAFQHDDLGVLGATDAQAQLDLLVQTGWFTSSPGGTRWNVVTQPDDEGNGEGRWAELDADQRAAWTALRRTQQRLDDVARALAGAQAALADATWKTTRISAWGPQPPMKPPAEQAAAAEAAREAADAEALTLIGGYRYARQARDTAFVVLRRALDGSTVPLEIRAEAVAPFYAPADPVLLVTGAHRAWKHGEDGRFDDDGNLICRFTGQTIDGLTVDVKGAPVLVDAAHVPVPPIAHDGLPPETSDLLAEAFFLDTGNAPLIAQVASPGDPWPLLAAIRTEQTLIWNAAAHPDIEDLSITEASGLHFLEGRGAVPSKIGVDFWTPPWSPLFLAWSVTFFPGQQPATASLEPWLAPADRTPVGLDDLTYSWAAGRSPLTPGSTTISGRTLLTPQATDVLALRLRRTIEDLGDTPAVQDDLWALLLALDHVESADVLSQAMSGFGDALLRHFGANYRMPSSPALDQRLRPDGAPAYTPTAIPAPVGDASLFNPIRAGHLQVDKLWVVDGFGQVFDVKGAMGITVGGVPLINAPDLVTEQTGTLAELKPRVGQPARVDLAWLDADRDDVELAGDADADAVCGWFLLNHLDRSLMVYESDGSPLGEVIATPDRARWMPAPERPPALTNGHGNGNGDGRDAVDIPNRHVRAVVTDLVGRADSRDALLALLDLIDRTTWTLNPGGGWPDAELPVLIGRPLVVARAALRQELRGAPAIRQGWDDSGKDLTDGFPGVAFPVQLGSTELLDDGLVGFYLDDDTTHLNTVRGLLDDDLTIAGSTYIGHDRPTIRPDGERTALLTMLLDPHAGVHVITGTGPVQSVALPPDAVEDALARLAVTFRTGPVLGTDVRVAMPLPALRSGTWSWLERDDPAAAARVAGVASTDATASLLDALPTFREGWLKLLLDGPPTTFRYTTVPGDVRCTTDPEVPSTAALQLSVYNPSDAVVPCSRITWTLPVGPAAEHLAQTAATFTPSLLAPASPPGPVTWTATVADAEVILEPVAPNIGMAPGETVVVLVAGVQVNTAPGRATIGIEELTDTTRTASLAVSKLAAALA